MLTVGVGVGALLPQVGCKALVFPKQFKTQQYYNILKQICPELEKAQPGALKSQRWGAPGPFIPYPSPGMRLVSPRAFPQPLTLTIFPTPQASRSDHSHLSGCLSARDPAPG